MAAADYDNDGWPDLYVSNLGGGNFLYRNNRDGTFTELARGGRRARRRTAASPTWFFDYDNDGWQDLFVDQLLHCRSTKSARTYLGLPHNANTLKLYRNLGDGSFQDVTAAGRAGQGVHADGRQLRRHRQRRLSRHLSRHRQSVVRARWCRACCCATRAGQSFVDVTASSGTGELHKGHGVAFADLDNDGDEEIVFEVGGATPGDAHALRLFENPGHGNDWLSLKLVGVQDQPRRHRRPHHGDRRGRGGRARAPSTARSAAAARSAPRRCSSTSASARRRGIVDVEIWWPTSNTRQRFANVDKNQLLEITRVRRATTRRSTRPPLPSGRSDDRDADTRPVGARARWSLGAGRCVLAAAHASARSSRAQYAMTRHGARGRRRSRSSFVVSHDSIAGLMEAMTMPFDVREPKELDGVAPGTIVEFTLVVGEGVGPRRAHRASSATRAWSRIR